MPAIPDDPGRRGAVGIVVREGRFLVIRRSAAVVAPGTLCFPGGGLEPNETEADALVREFHEELGATIRPLRRVWQCVTPWKVRLSFWQCDLAHDSPLTPNPAEVEGVYWHTLDEIRSLPDFLESNQELLRALAHGRIKLNP